MHLILTAIAWRFCQARLVIRAEDCVRVSLLLPQTFFQIYTLFWPQGISAFRPPHDPLHHTCWNIPKRSIASIILKRSIASITLFKSDKVLLSLNNALLQTTHSLLTLLSKQRWSIVDLIWWKWHYIILAPKFLLGSKCIKNEEKKTTGKSCILISLIHRGHWRPFYLYWIVLLS